MRCDHCSLGPIVTWPQLLFCNDGSHFHSQQIWPYDINTFLWEETCSITFFGITPLVKSIDQLTLTGHLLSTFRSGSPRSWNTLMLSRWANYRSNTRQNVTFWKTWGEQTEVKLPLRCIEAHLMFAKETFYRSVLKVALRNRHRISFSSENKSHNVVKL